MNLKRDVDEARIAFNKKDKDLLVRAHSKHKEIHDKGHGKYLKSWVYGGLDGIVTTFAVVSGVIGASLSSSVILILGFANLIADGISMAIGDYLSTKSEKEYYGMERAREEWEVKNYPEGEKREMIEIYSKKGVSKKDANVLVKILSKNKTLWIDTMMSEELGLKGGEKVPLKNAGVTFGSFILFGFIPLVFYLAGVLFNLKLGNQFLVTSLFTGGALFFLGSMKTKITGRNWLRSGIEMLLIGGLASGAAYLVGWLLQGVF